MREERLELLGVSDGASFRDRGGVSEALLTPCDTSIDSVFGDGLPEGFQGVIGDITDDSGPLVIAPIASKGVIQRFWGDRVTGHGVSICSVDAVVNVIREGTMWMQSGWQTVCVGINRPVVGW